MFGMMKYSGLLVVLMWVRKLLLFVGLIVLSGCIVLMLIGRLIDVCVR